jgi:hypothetical protein
MRSNPGRWHLLTRIDSIGRIPRVPIALLALLVASCGGGGDGGSPSLSPAPPTVPPSAGGVWGSVVGAQSVSLLIAEDGDLRLVGQGPTFGAGSVTVSASGQLSGSVRRVVPSGISLGSEVQQCSITGTVTARTALAATFSCTTPAGANVTQRFDFLYVSSAYDSPSSVGGLAGNYTLAFRPASNMLNVNSNGVVFAMYDNAWRCTVNGRFSVIDVRFNLYRAEWTFAACAVPGSQAYEGVTFTGFAQRTTSTPNSGAAPGNAIYVLLTSTVQNRLSWISVVYDPT